MCVSSGIVCLIYKNYFMESYNYFGHSIVGCFKHLRNRVLILFLNYSTYAEKYSKDINVQNGSLVTSETLCNHYTTQAKKENIIT